MTTYTMEDYTRISGMLAKGITEIEYQGKKIKYSSLDDMQRIRVLMANELGLNNKPNANRKTGIYNSGL